ncbi:MAG: hypothetical protein QMC36_02940 [Patescibacteria group bacterium]
MKKQALSALVLVGLGMASSQAFADNGTAATATERPAHRMGTGALNENANRKEGRGQEYKEFLRTDLTASETATLTGAIELNRTSMKALMDSLKAGTLTQADFDTQAKALRESLKNVIVTYVQSDKVADFYAEFAKVPTAPQNGNEARKTDKNGTFVADAPTKAAKKTSYLPSNIGTSLDAKLAAYSNDTDRKAWLDAVIGKVETMESKAKKTKTKALLQEFKTLLQEKIDALDDSVSTDDSESIDAIFQ